MMRVTTSEMWTGDEWLVNAYIHQGRSEVPVEWIVDAARGKDLATAREQAVGMGRELADILHRIYANARAARKLQED